jgi:5'-3' exonuclease
MKTRYDIAVLDGNYCAWRALFAHPDLSTRIDGEWVSTGMAYGFLQTIVSLKQHYDVGEIIVGWDDRESSHRRVIYPKYKANRKKDKQTIDHWLASRDVVVAILDRLPIAQITSPGREADDVIASVCHQAKGKKLIVGSDHDLFQLLSKDVAMLILRKNIEFVYSVKRFQKEYGIPPKKYWQVMALTGDRGDNVPGIRGVGEKTAIKLLQTFPDLVKGIVKEGVTLPEDAADELARRCGSLNKAVETVRLARRLTKLYRGVKLNRPRFQAHWGAFLEILGKYAFDSMMVGDRRKALRSLFDGDSS